MSDKEKRNPEINGNKYHVIIVQTKRRQCVSVHRHKSYRTKYNRSNVITTLKEWKGSWLWFGADRSSPVEKLIQQTLNEAVCIREDKIERQDKYETRIDSAIENIAEVHE